MLLHSVQPLLAAFDFGTAVSIIFLLIAFVSWILQAIGGNNGPARRGPRVPPQAGQKPRRNPELQNEIDSFLAQVRQRGGAKPQSAGPPPRRPVPERPRRQTPQPQRESPRPVSADDRTGRPVKPHSDRQRQVHRDQEPAVNRETVDQHHLESSLSQRHLEHLKQKVAAEAAIPASVEESAKQIERLGVSMGGVTERAVDDDGVHPIVDSFRDPARVRHAIIMLEVLGRPKALQRPSHR